MRDYGKVHTSFWTSSNIRSMSEDGRTLAMYLLTCPHGTIAGVFRLPDGYACEDLQWVSERVNKGFAELFDNGFANRCETTKWVWISKHFEWNPPENPNQKKAAAKVAAQVPDECRWKSLFMRDCANFIGADNTPKTNHSETLIEPFLNQEQEQEQEQEKKRAEGAQDDASPSAHPASKKSTGSRLPTDWMLPKAWGEWALQERADWNAETVRSVAEQFADHWRAKAGADARKADWLATWRNWVRRESSTRSFQPQTSSVTPLHDHRCRHEENGQRCEAQGVRGKNGKWYCHDHKHELEATA